MACADRSLTFFTQLHISVSPFLASLNKSDFTLLVTLVEMFDKVLSMGLRGDVGVVT